MIAGATDADALQRRRTRRGRLMIGAAVAAGVMLVLANIHLVYVAVSSQPECIAPQDVEGEASMKFRAAKPAC